jgi:hypothetical protein
MPDPVPPFPDGPSWAQHFADLLAAKDLRDEQRYQASALALTVALDAINAHLATLNELRKVVEDVLRGCATKAEVQQIFDRLTETINGVAKSVSDVADRVAAIEGRSKGVGASWGVLVGAIGGIAGLVGMVTAIVTAVHH